MINLRGRAKQRGKPLDAECYRAHRTTHEYGMKDDRVFCYGLCADWSVYEVAEKCLKCGAYVDNAEPYQPEGKVE